jgi:hypothetical protein
VRTSLVSASQFFGIDIKEFAVELAKVIGGEYDRVTDAMLGLKMRNSAMEVIK